MHKLYDSLACTIPSPATGVVCQRRYCLTRSMSVEFLSHTTPHHSITPLHSFSIHLQYFDMSAAHSVVVAAMSDPLRSEKRKGTGVMMDWTELKWGRLKNLAWSLGVCLESGLVLAWGAIPILINERHGGNGIRKTCIKKDHPRYISFRRSLFPKVRQTVSPLA